MVKKKNPLTNNESNLFFISYHKGEKEMCWGYDSSLDNNPPVWVLQEIVSILETQKHHFVNMLLEMKCKKETCNKNNKKTKGE